MTLEEAAAANPPSTPPLPPLDEVMVAMDVVDTLRHEEDLVRQELTGDERREALVRRLQDLYANQGIVVPEEVIRKGVFALEEDRFTYAPPERSWSVRLAEMYIRRGFIGKWLLALLLLGLLLWGVYIIPKKIEQSRRLTALKAQATEVAEDERAEFEAVRELIARHGKLQESPLLSPVLSRLLTEARDDISTAESLKTQLTALKATSELSEDNIFTRLKKVGGLKAALSQASSKLDSVEAMLGFEPKVAKVLAELAGTQLDEDARTSVEGISARARAMSQAGNAEGALKELSALKDLIRELNSVYELRIVSSQNRRSGVFRESTRGGNFRNYYIIVQALDASGTPLSLSFTDEELDRRVSAHTFGVRVPPSVYEKVKADKLDNQIIDRPLFARKPAGTSKLKYFYETSGGRITRW